MKKIPLKKRATKLDGWEFNRAMMGEELPKKKAPFEPVHTGGKYFKEDSAQSSIIKHLIGEMGKGKLFFQRTNNTPIYDANLNNGEGGFRAMPTGSHKGFPDILVIKDKRIIFLEVKSATGSQSDHQVKMQHWVEKQGAEYYIVRSWEYARAAIYEYLPPQKADQLPF